MRNVLFVSLAGSVVAWSGTAVAQEKYAGYGSEFEQLPPPTLIDPFTHDTSVVPNFSVHPTIRGPGEVIPSSGERGYPTEVPVDPDNSDHYINNLNQKRYILYNNATNGLLFRFDWFELDDSVDEFCFGIGCRTSDDNDLEPHFDEGLSDSVEPVVMSFSTDDSGTALGFRISGIVPFDWDGEPVPGYGTSKTNVPLGQRIIGVLNDQGDTFMFRIDGSTQYATQIALWTDQQDYHDRDIDMFARCGDGTTPSIYDPTPTLYDYAAISELADEWLELPASNCLYWHIAVHAYAVPDAGDIYPAAATVNMFIGRQKPVLDRHIRIGADRVLTAAELATLQAELPYFMMHTYFMGEGTAYLRSATIYNDGSCEQLPTAGDCGTGPCDVCFNTVPEGCWQGGAVNVDFSYLDDPYCLPHEWGHWLYGLPDEYEDPPQAYGSCGHTIMAGGAYWGATEVPGWPHGVTGFCTANDHGEDGESGSPLFGSSGWTLIWQGGLGDVVYPMFNTPDNQVPCDHFAAKMVTVTVAP